MFVTVTTFGSKHCKVLSIQYFVDTFVYVFAGCKPLVS